MAECGNMPDWHPYNPPSSVGRPTVPSGSQNASTGHMFISSLSPPAMDGINLTSERHQSSKHQNDGSYVGRNYTGGTIASTNCTTSSSLTSHIAPLAACVSHYAGGTSTRNPMMDNLGGAMDPRMGPVAGMNDEVAHRNSQMNFSGPTNHSSAANLNVNAGPSTMHNSPVGPLSPGRQAGYGACKAPCCHPDANMTYQHWDKYGHYHGSAPNGHTSYRDNLRQSAYQPVDNRRYIPDTINLRKDPCLDKELVDPTVPFPVDHRRNYDYKYPRKESVMSRNYPAPSNGMLPNYPMQNYNFPPNDYQKCPYSVKDYVRRGGNNGGSINSKNSSVHKYQEQQSVIVQQKYSHSKQMQYQNGGVLPSTATSGNLPSSLQNSYYNAPQIPRDLSRDYSRDYGQEQGANRMPQVPPPSSSHIHGSFQKYHVYHQKIAMQRYTVENHLRAYSRIPGYQSHPKYQECVMRYRELLRLQQTVDYQNVLQESPKVPSPSNAAPTPVAPINLQFDQNGILINSNYIPGNYPGIHGPINPMGPTESADTTANARITGNAGNLEQPNQFIEHNDQSINLTRDLDSQIHQGNVTAQHHDSNERYFVAGEKNDHARSYERLRNHESLDTINVDVEGVVETTTTTKATEPPIATSVPTTTIAPSMPTVATPSSVEYKNSKDFADKPELDVRQFLANWDESEDEDAAASTNVASTTLNEQFEGAAFPSKSPSTGAIHEDPTSSANDRNSQENKDESSQVANASGSSPSTDSNSDIDIGSNENSPINICDSGTITKEIQCIRTDDGDDIPTIHIVDSLETGTDLEKIHTVFGSLASSVLNPISIDDNPGEIVCENVNKGETIVLFEQQNGVCAKTLEFSVSSEVNNSEVVEGVIASIIESSSVDAASQEIETSEKSPYKSPEATDSSSDQMTTEESPPTATSSSTSSVASSTCSSKTSTDNVDTANLRKQNSFTSDESHNPDDISLPDLQTSECTPVSTTLNTPIHSDSEESSEHVSDLTISTNPIEIIQNSPIISFTHSPIKIEPYEQLDGRMGRPARRTAAEQLDRHDSLDFDFDREVACRENTKYTEQSETSATSGVEGLEESEATRVEDSRLLADIQESTVQNSYSEEPRAEPDREDEFYRTADPLVGMAHITETASKDHSDEATEICQAEAPNDENNRSNCDSPVDRILQSDELDTDKCPSLMERDDDFNRSTDLEKLCDMSLDGSCMMPLISADDCDKPTVTVEPMESSNCFTKILNDLPIEDLDALQSPSDIEELGKPDDDMWSDARYIDKQLDEFAPSSWVQRENSEMKRSRKHAKSAKVRNDKASPTETKQHGDDKIDDTSQNEVAYKSSNLSESESDERSQNPEPLSRETMSSENPQRDKHSPSPTIELQKASSREQKLDDYTEEETAESRESRKRRSSREERDNEYVRRNVADSEVEARSPITKSYTTKHRDSNVEIHLANFNVKIHDNEIIRNETVGSKVNNQESCSSSDGLDAIEIKINLSRSDVSRRIGKQLQDKFVDDERRVSQEMTDVREPSPQARETNVCGSSKKCCRRRRRSMPDGFETKKSRRLDEERIEATDHYAAKKISKSRNRHKVRRSMDDELLLTNTERSRKETSMEERNFHLEMAKAFNLPWPRDDPETGDSSTSLMPKEDDSKKDKKSSTKSKADGRTEKHGKDVRTIPSPSYNSALDNSSTMDFDNFDVAPHHSSDTDPEQGDSMSEIRYSRVKRARLEDRDRYRNPSSYGTSFDELASLDAFEINLNTVPIYTTKDGRITYSPNRNYTYRALIMEARQREGYPALRKLHYPRHLPRNHHYREATLRKLYKKRQDERTGHEKKRRGVDYHSGKSKCATTSRHHMEDTEARLSMRTKKHENRRRETRVPSELEYCSDDATRGYVDDSLTNKNRSVETIAASYKPETHAKIAQQREDSPINRRTENSRKDEHADNSRIALSNYKTNSAVMNTVDDTLRSPKHYANRENENCLVSKIFQGQEMEISTRKVSPACDERAQNERNPCVRQSRFFPESSHALKTPMASPLINLEKRPIGWDIEQDCQAALSDSGLESSTTYVEASKESRRIQRWKNFLVDKAVTAKAIYNTPSDRYNEAIDLSHEKLQNDENLYFDDEPKDLRIKDNDNEERRVDVESCDVSVPEIRTLEVEETKNICESVERTADTEKKRIAAEATISVEPLDDDALRNDRMSEIVKSLDLAISHRHRATLKESRTNRDRDSAKPFDVDNDRDDSTRAASIFRCDRESTNCVMRKASEALSRRASSDAVESRDSSRIEFFRGPTIAEITEAERESKIVREEIEEPEFFDRHSIVDEPENLDSQTATNQTIERAASPEIFQTRCKDFLIDTSTSFSSCMKVPELVSALPTESESSQLEDTSTRFAGESMDFKETRDEGSNDGSQSNFKETRDDATNDGSRNNFIGPRDEASNDGSRSNFIGPRDDASNDGSRSNFIGPRDDVSNDGTRSNFMPFASHGIMNSSIMTNDTSGRDSFLCDIAENAMNASEDCSIGRKSFESMEKSADSDRRSGESSGTAPILSFSGQITNDSRHTDSPSKSPPSLSCETSIPKIVIKKNEVTAKSQPLDASTSSSRNEFEKKISHIEHDSSSHPKIPKMIIRNVRSRPATPTAIEEDETEATKLSVLEQRVFEVAIKLDGETTKSETSTECKVPKMKIKLEDKQQPRMILDSSKASSVDVTGEQSKNVPKVKIRKIRRSSTSRSPMRAGKLSRQPSESEIRVEYTENTENSNASSSYKFTVEKSTSRSHGNACNRVEKIDDETRQDRIPKLTIKKQEVGATSSGSGYSSSQTLKKRRSRSPGESGAKKQRKSTSSRHGSSKRDETRSRERRANSLDSNDGTTDSQSPSEKIPKVIIKRTSPSAEFKCELSKVGREAITKDSKWQPEVKLQRSWVLDFMAKEPGSGKLALKMLETSKNYETSEKKSSNSKRSVAASARHRSSSTVEGKTRRRSDCDFNETKTRYSDEQSPRMLTASNNRSKSFDENINAIRRVSRENEASNDRLSGSVKSNTLPVSTKVKRDHADGSSKNDKYEYADRTEKTEESREKQDGGETNASRTKGADKHARSFEETESSVIKLDSSDESQTTIELLPASPDNSQPESLDTIEQSSEVEQCVGNGSMGKLYSDEAIPTQFELELEIVDHSTVDSLDVPIPLPDESSLEDDSTSTIERGHRLEHCKSYRLHNADDNESTATDLGCEKFTYDEESKSVALRKSPKSDDKDTKNICCSDSLVKEVLAAKETLKRCLTKSKSVARTKLKPRTKTAAEKKQGSGFDFVRLAEYAKTSKCHVEERAAVVFHDTVKASKINETIGCSKVDGRAKSENCQSGREQTRREDKKTCETSEKQERYRKSWNNESRHSGRSRDEHTSSSTSSKSSKRSSLPSTNVSPTKTSSSVTSGSGKSNEHENFGENSRSKSGEKSSSHRSLKSTEKSSERQGSVSKVPDTEDSSKKIKSYKIPKISRSHERNSGEEANPTEDKRKSPSPAKMPILEPQIDLNFEIAGSDRDTSRSPPVITKQEDPEIDREVPKKIEDNVNTDKLDSITKQQDSEAVTFADIVSQLAYHEKATIRHRRYCNLCERWFPSTIRHERHLSGYQHRHTELTQRRTVHALFMLFTGKPCPRLLPASIVRTDCLPGEPTPLQIAVQDVAISLEDGARVKPNKDVSSKDE